MFQLLKSSGLKFFAIMLRNEAVRIMLVMCKANFLVQEFL